MPWYGNDVCKPLFSNFAVNYSRMVCNIQYRHVSHYMSLFRKSSPVSDHWHRPWKIPIFPGKYHQHGGFSWATVSQFQGRVPRYPIHPCLNRTRWFVENRRKVKSLFHQVDSSGDGTLGCWKTHHFPCNVITSMAMWFMNAWPFEGWFLVIFWRGQLS